MHTSLITLAVALTLAGCSAPKTEASGKVQADAVPETTAPATDMAAPAVNHTNPADTMPGMTADEHAAMDAAGTTHADADAHVAADASNVSSAVDDMKGMDMDSGSQAMASGAQAGWYRAGTFRACGSSASMKVDKAAQIDQKIKAGGMSAGDPVYVKLEGMPMGDSYMLTKVVAVGSKTPIRDCVMSDPTNKVGG